MKGGAYANFDWDKIPPIAFPMSTYKDYFISIHNPEKKDTLLLKSPLISEQDKEKLKKMKMDDNAMLVFFKMKKF